jgi:hypothetical protein
MDGGEVESPRGRRPRSRDSHPCSPEWAARGCGGSAAKTDACVSSCTAVSVARKRISAARTIGGSRGDHDASEEGAGAERDRERYGMSVGSCGERGNGDGGRQNYGRRIAGGGSAADGEQERDCRGMSKETECD